MRVEDAETIVRVYGAVIERELGRSSAAPESVLPCDKATLREALLTYARALHRTNALDEDTRGVLATGYMLLSSFIPDDEARRARAAEAILRPAPRSVEEAKARAAELACVLDNYTAILQRVGEEGSLLLAEFYGFEKGIGARDYRVDTTAELEAGKKDVEDAFRRAKRLTGFEKGIGVRAYEDDLIAEQEIARRSIGDMPREGPTDDRALEGLDYRAPILVHLLCGEGPPSVGVVRGFLKLAEKRGEDWKEVYQDVLRAYARLRPRGPKPPPEDEVDPTKRDSQSS